MEEWSAAARDGRCGSGDMEGWTYRVREFGRRVVGVQARRHRGMELWSSCVALQECRRGVMSAWSLEARYKRNDMEV